jgi:hypothetical protein
VLDIGHLLSLLTDGSWLVSLRRIAGTNIRQMARLERQRLMWNPADSCYPVALIGW